MTKEKQGNDLISLANAIKKDIRDADIKSASIAQYGLRLFAILADDNKYTEETKEVMLCIYAILYKITSLTKSKLVTSTELEEQIDYFVSFYNS